MSSGDSAESDGETLPQRQVWYPAHRRQTIGFVTAFVAVLVCGVVYLLVSDYLASGGSWLFVALLALQAVLLASRGWYQSRTWLETDPTGLHLVGGRRRDTYPWEEVTEIRPSIVKGGRRTYLVLVRSRGLTVDLPVTEERLHELRRWHEASR